MKGPYERLKYDLRRLWECPSCNRRERTAGTVTFRHCACQLQKLDGKPVVMKLIEDGVQRLVPAIRAADLSVAGTTASASAETAAEELSAAAANPPSEPTSPGSAG